MASKKPNSQQMEDSRKIIDPTSLLIGIVIAALILGAAWFAFSALQKEEQQPPAQPPAAPVQVIANSRLPSNFQIVVKNNEKENIRISGIRIGASEYNLTANLSPGEIAEFSLTPPDCALGQAYSCSVSIIYELGGSSASSSQNVSGNYTQQTSGTGQNGTGGQGGSQAPELLSILTTEIPAGTQDLQYGFSLEATGGSGSYSWSVSGLPSDLSAISSGRITGEALEAGTFTVHIVLSDGSASVSRDLALVINENPG